MSFKDFSRLNEFIATTADVTDKLNSIISACQQGVTQLSAIKQISDAYARQYSLVQQIQYDADGNIQDVTSAERLSVPNTVLDNAKDTINKCSLAIKRINPVELGSAAVTINTHPVASLYHYVGINSNEKVAPSNVKTIADYYYLSGNALYLSSEFLEALTALGNDVGFKYNTRTIVVQHPIIVKIPYNAPSVTGEHKLSILADVKSGSMYMQHTGDFTKYSLLSDILGKDLFSASSYNIEHSAIGQKIEWRLYAQDTGWFQLANGAYGMAGDILNFEYDMNSNTYTADSIDCYHNITTHATDDIWAILTGLADNGKRILDILSVI